MVILCLCRAWTGGGELEDKLDPVRYELWRRLFTNAMYSMRARTGGQRPEQAPSHAEDTRWIPVCQLTGLPRSLPLPKRHKEELVDMIEIGGADG